jgi:hypothetical protein
LHNSVKVRENASGQRRFMLKSHINPTATKIFFIHHFYAAVIFLLEMLYALDQKVFAAAL